MIIGSVLSDDQTNLIFFPLILHEEIDIPALRTMSGHVCHCDFVKESDTLVALVSFCGEHVLAIMNCVKY